MKTGITFLIFFFATFKSFACSCDTPKIAVEFYQAKYVFKGEVIDKIYSSDSLTYTVTFEVSKHFKNGDNPGTLKFELISEGEITGNITSCDWNVQAGETWLIYAKEGSDNSLYFGYYCSNSKPLDYKAINQKEQKILHNGNDLDLTAYRYQFFKAVPVTNTDSILEKYKKRKFDPSGFAPIWVDVDDNGDLETANLAPRKEPTYEVVDTIFNMNQFKNDFEEPRTNFEKTALEIAGKIKKWEKYYFLDLKESVKYRSYLKFTVDKDSIIHLEH
ncbi:hypothetical protein SAMN04488034_101443 [Salinimicrobium catena]|uniref:Tissue inhibitor of metalloproteinase n=1 Tax=Salinimicrobium catena TaxID=390640 RepID=A0A1H5IIT8_9FLAO|nr:hypothetical protein [Salinimicrobium catena]SDK78110.1 hypothetical protein SAMN04488140_101443 [Salinimicrobium catena]SEE40126.1 hypothetical protein SAMN04488034_101443 [Salinimicrobium catena]